MFESVKHSPFVPFPSVVNIDALAVGHVVLELPQVDILIGKIVGAYAFAFYFISV